MATTSPDGLFSPDADAPYNLTADWAASMSSVQLALLNRANHVGTTAQRNAFAAQPGALWWDTTLSQAFIYNGSAWVAITGGDTGWVDISSSLTSAFSSSDLVARRKDGVVYVTGTAAGTFTGRFITGFLSLPSQFRPSKTGTGSALFYTNSTNVESAGVSVQDNGGVTIYRNETTARTTVRFSFAGL